MKLSDELVSSFTTIASNVISSLSIYRSQIDGIEFAQKILDKPFIKSTEDFNNDDYVIGKFRQFQSNFGEFLSDCDSQTIRRLAEEILIFEEK